MGYDLFVLTVRRPNENVKLPALTAAWERKGEGWVYAKKSGQVVINDPEAIEIENVPEKAIAFMPELRFSTEINVEGKASNELYAVTLQAANRLASRGIRRSCPRLAARHDVRTDHTTRIGRRSKFKLRSHNICGRQAVPRRAILVSSCGFWLNVKPFARYL